MPSDAQRPLEKQLADTVKQYEGKLATLSVFNDALQRENNELRAELEQRQAPKSANDQEVAELTQEFSKRMAAKDRDLGKLKKTVEDLKAKLESGLGGTSAQARLRDREGYIASLQQEGEALARKNGELEATARKLRVQVKEAEADRDRLQRRSAQQDELLGTERGRLEKQLAEAQKQVRQMQLDQERLEREATAQINAALQEGMAAAEVARQEAEAGGSSALQEALARESQLTAFIEDLQARGEEARSQWSLREEALRREIAEAEVRLRDQEAEHSEAIAMASQGTQPLLRQIESIMASTKAQDQARRASEGRLQAHIEALEASQQSLSDEKQLLETEVARLQARVDAAESSRSMAEKSLSEAGQKLDQQRQKSDHLGKLLQQTERELQVAKSSAAELKEAVADKKDMQSQLRQAQRQVMELSRVKQQQKKQERPAAEDGSRTAEQALALPVSTASSSQLEERANAGSAEEEAVPLTPGYRASAISDQLDKLFSSASDQERHRQLVGRNGIKALHDPGGSQAIDKRLEAAEALVKQANEELLQAYKRAQAAESEASSHQATKQRLKVLESRHGQALEVIGACDEKIRTLEDDISDMKSIFHTQLSTLVDEVNLLRQSAKQEIAGTSDAAQTNGTLH